VYPIEIVVHEAGTKSFGAPILQVLIDSPGLSAELPPFSEQLAVMVEIMDTHLEAVLRQIFPHIGGNPVPAFRHEVEGRTEAEFLFEHGQISDLGQAPGGLHIVRQNQGEFLATRPARPTLGGQTGGPVNRPDILTRPQRFPRNSSSQGHPKAPRQVGLNLIIDAVS
jgi:hypothetical protein